MNSYLCGRVSAFTDNKNADASVILINIGNSEQIKSVSWNETLEAILVKDTQKGQIQFANAWNEKPAKMLQWYKEDESIRFEIWYQVKGTEWTFKNEYIISNTDMKAFEQIHKYNLEIMSNLKKDFSDEVLDGTSFLTRD